MAIDIGTQPNSPEAGKNGHFAHHEWLAEAVKALSEEAVQAPPTVVEIDPAASDALAKVVDVLVSMGVAKKKV